MKTAGESWRLLIAEWRFTLLLGVSLVAFMLLVLPVWQSLVALPLLAGAGMKDWIPDPGVAFVVWDLLMEAPLYVGLAVALVPLHRRILIGEDRRLPFRFRRPEAAYAAFLFLLEASLSVLIVLLANPILGLQQEFWKLGAEGVIPDRVAIMLVQALIFGLVILALAPLIYVYTRLSLALPGVAIGTPSAVARGWRIGRGNGWRLVAVSTLVFLPALFFIATLSGIWSVDGDAGLDGPILLDPEMVPESAWTDLFVVPSAEMALGALFYAMIYLPGATAVSLAYKRLAGKNDEANADVIS